MKFNRLDYTVWAVLGALAVALAGLMLAGDRVGARVLRSFPLEGGAVSAYRRVGVEFAQAMQPASVAAHFMVEPAVPGTWQWVGLTAWFAPSQAYVPGTTYTARLTPGAASTHGRETRAEVAWTFTVRQPRVGYLSPASGGPPEVWRTAAVSRQLPQRSGLAPPAAAAPGWRWSAGTRLSPARVRRRLEPSG